MFGAVIARVRGRRYGETVRCFTGRTYWPRDPRPEDVHIDDVAHGLANACLYAGQCLDYYSYAEHSVLVSEHAERLALERSWDLTEVYTVTLEALLYNASRAYLHVPDALNIRNVNVHFGINPARATRALIHEIKARTTGDEIIELACDAEKTYVHATYGDTLGTVIECLSPYDAESRFLQRFFELVPEYA